MSWFRKAVWRRNNSPATQSNQQQQEEEDSELGVTQQLQDFIKSFTLDTFKNFPLQDDEDDPTVSANVRKDLNDWQERHATHVLVKVKEISQLRYVLCPRHLKERQFWRIYFNLVKSYVIPYEIRAIQKARLRRMGKEDEKLDNAIEVEMAEAKGPISVSASTSSY